MVFPIFLIRVISQIILNLDLIYLLLYLFQILLSFLTQSILIIIIISVLELDN